MLMTHSFSYLYFSPTPSTCGDILLSQALL